MKYSEYRVAAPKTCNSKAWCLEHWVDGFVNEAAELHSLTKKRHYGMSEDDLLTMKRTSLLEEMGDLCWFLSCFFTWYDEQEHLDEYEHSWDMEDPMIMQTDMPLRRVFNKLVIKASKALDHVDYAEMHLEMSNGRIQVTPAPLIYGLACDMRNWLNVARIKIGVTWEEIFQKNIHKLQGVRYKGGWTKDKALNRDTDAEMEAIENA